MTPRPHSPSSGDAQGSLLSPFVLGWPKVYSGFIMLQKTPNELFATQ